MKSFRSGEFRYVRVLYGITQMSPFCSLIFSLVAVAFPR
jgi:hypothetical protein